ncbi:MAG: acetate/propionate family kinase [Rhizobacter sp.]
MNGIPPPDPGTAGTRHVLALNSGSSSLKFGLYRVGPCGIDQVVAGEAEMIGDAAAFIHAENALGHAPLRETLRMDNQRAVVIRIGRLLSELEAPLPDAVGHRVVHGGPKLREHCVIDEAVLQRLEASAAFAPLHTPAALALIRFAAENFPGLPQVACLDTCFHARMPSVASTLPLPGELRSAGIQRYGFHGLSCESIVRQLSGALPARLIIAHLGNGASITAVKQGSSIDTSMGMTPTGGLIMGTRSGDLDPGVLVHVMREMKLDAAALEELVDHRSGLLGLSGLSGDMRVLHQAAPSNGDARLAIEMFAYVAAKELGAMSTVLGGVDMIVFTGGIGEHDAAVRADICARLSCLGVELDAERNRRGDGSISRESSRCKVHVLPSQEDEQIARHTWALCGLHA